MLVEAGADVNKRYATLTFPPFKWGVDGMVSTVLPKGSWTPLMYAARQNSVVAATRARGGRCGRERGRSRRQRRRC